MMQCIDQKEEIAAGNVCKVYKVILNKAYALKVMNMKNVNHENFKKLINEYEIMNMLDHPNILKAIAIYFGNSTTPPSIFLEFCPKTLDNSIRSLSKVQIAFSIYQIVEGMKYIHFQKIIHRDLKPSNILYAEDGTLRIGDFGISKLMSIQDQQSTATGGVGTLFFMAPEILNNESNYNEKADVYSFGVLVYFMLSGGKMPETSIGNIAIGQKAMIPTTFTKFSKNLIDSCWNFDPKDRPSFNEICGQIEQTNNKLIDLSAHEKNELRLLIMQHKEKIPSFEH